MAKKYYKVEFEDFGWENILELLEDNMLGKKGNKKRRDLARRYVEHIEDRLKDQGFSRTEHLT